MAHLLGKAAALVSVANRQVLRAAVLLVRAAHSILHRAAPPSEAEATQVPQAAAGGLRRALIVAVALHRLRWLRTRLRTRLGAGLGARARGWIGALLDRVRGLDGNTAHAGLATTHAKLDVALVSPCTTPAVLHNPVVPGLVPGLGVLLILIGVLLSAITNQLEETEATKATEPQTQGLKQATRKLQLISDFALYPETICACPLLYVT